MNELKVFYNDELGQVRTVTKDGEHWFVAKDVCDILAIKNPRTSTALLDDDEKEYILWTPLEEAKNSLLLTSLDCIH